MLLTSGFGTLFIRFPFATCKSVLVFDYSVYSVFMFQGLHMKAVYIFSTSHFPVIIHLNLQRLCLKLESTTLMLILWRMLVWRLILIF
ncbi:hypothetical protein CsatB_023220 [Cannabis sativa]